MNNRTFSFSVKTEADHAFVAALKLACAKQGKNFSKVVLDALKESAEKREQNVKTQ